MPSTRPLRVSSDAAKTGTLSSRKHSISRRQVVLVLAGAAASVAMRVECQPREPSQPPVDSRVPGPLRKIVVEQLGVDEAEVKWDARLVEDLGADELDIVELIMALEEEFTIEIPDGDAEKFQRVGEVVEYLRKRKVLK
jgi:acyl carrier protein